MFLGLVERRLAISDRIVRIRLTTAIVGVLVVVLGLGCKYYRGPAATWVNNYGPASVFYEMLFVLLFFFVFPGQRAATKIAIGVCLGTCLIEFAQLFHPPWLEHLRASFLGRMLLGTSFSWWDFPAYPVGSFCGWVVVNRIARHFEDTVE